MKKRTIYTAASAAFIFLFVMFSPFFMNSAKAASGVWTDYRASAYTAIDTGARTISISTAGELALLAYQVNTGVDLAGYTISILDDIDLSAHYWTPIGNSAYKFKGNIEGNNYIISNMIVDIRTLTNDSVDRFIGFIGYMDGSYRVAYIQDLSVNGSIYSETSTGDMSNYHYLIGGLVGIANYCTFTNCGTDVDITAIRNSNISTTIGGLIGQMHFDSDETLVNCYSVGDIVFSKTNSTYINPATDTAVYVVGGLVGYLMSDRFGGVANNYSNSDISVTMLDDGEAGSTIHVNVGGFCGMTGRGTYPTSEYYDNCVASGEIDCNVNEIPLTGTGTSTYGNDLNAGGFTGSLGSVALHDCYYLYDTAHNGNTLAYESFGNNGSGYTAEQLLANGLTGLTPTQMANSATFDDTYTALSGSSTYLNGTYLIVDALNDKASGGSTYVANPTSASVAWLPWVDSGDHPVFGASLTFQSNGGTAVATIIQEIRSMVAEPTAPTKAGSVFEGWYLDAALTQPVTWSYALRTNTTVYARWSDAPLATPTATPAVTPTAVPAETIPKTGDSSHLGALLYALAGALIISVIAVAQYLKKRNQA